VSAPQKKTMAEFPARLDGMAPKRSYGDGCATAHALDLVGERWALLVVRELLLGPKRFTDLREGLPGVSPNVLAHRLRELEDSRIVCRRRLPPPAAVQVYELTRWGKDLEAAVFALGRWAVWSLGIRHDAFISKDSHILSLAILFDPEAAAGVRLSFAVRLGEDPYSVRVADGKLELSRGEPDKPDARIDTDATLLPALLGGTVPITGDREAVVRFPALFPPPVTYSGAEPQRR
jgi:DNA-binding HxlR family transcriptional regulator